MSNDMIPVDKYSNFRLSPKYPTMPPHHEGRYIEQFFYDSYESTDVNHPEHISVFWTAYIDNPKHDIVVPKAEQLQRLLDGLDEKKEYFTVIQSSNGINFRLPPKTKVFSCAGKGVYWPIKSSEIIPIPLVVSPLENKGYDKDILCSFVGSDTHECRSQLKKIMTGKPDVIFEMGVWNWTFDAHKVSKFKNYMHRSKFSLCPRGFGPTSFRLYEAIQCGSIPVYIYDEPWLPYQDEIDWQKLCVMVHIDDTDDTYEILKSKTDEDIQSYLDAARTYYDDYFSFEGVCKQIVKSL